MSGSREALVVSFLTRATGEGNHNVVEGALHPQCAGSAPSVSPLFGVEPPPPHAAATGEDLTSSIVA